MDIHGHWELLRLCITFTNPNNQQQIKHKIKSDPTWFEHAAFWSGVSRATIAPRSQVGLGNLSYHIYNVELLNLTFVKTGAMDQTVPLKKTNENLKLQKRNKFLRKESTNTF